MSTASLLDRCPQSQSSNM